MSGRQIGVIGLRLHPVALRHARQLLGRVARGGDGHRKRIRGAIGPHGMSKHPQQRHAGPVVVGRGQLRWQVARHQDHLGVAGEQGQHGFGAPVPKKDPVLQERLDLAGDLSASARMSTGNWT